MNWLDVDLAASQNRTGTNVLAPRAPVEVKPGREPAHLLLRTRGKQNGRARLVHADWNDAPDEHIKVSRDLLEKLGAEVSAASVPAQVKKASWLSRLLRDRHLQKWAIVTLLVLVAAGLGVVAATDETWAKVAAAGTTVLAIALGRLWKIGD